MTGIWSTWQELVYVQGEHAKRQIADSKAGLLKQLCKQPTTVCFHLKVANIFTQVIFVL